MSNVTNMSYMFLMQPHSISQLEIGMSSVTNMRGVFQTATSFNQPIGDWDVSNVTDMRALFSYSGYNQDISNWNVSSVNDMGVCW